MIVFYLFHKKVIIHLRHIQQKGKNTILTAPCGTCILHWNRLLEPLIVGYMLLVVFHSLCVLGGYPISTNCTEFFLDRQLNCPIGGHHNHEIVFIFL